MTRVYLQHNVTVIHTATRLRDTCANSFIPYSKSWYKLSGCDIVFIPLSLSLSLSLLCHQDSVGGVEEGVGLFADSVVKVFTFGGEAVERCLKLTEGWGLIALIKSLREVIVQAC